MNVKRYFITSLVGFIFVFVYDAIVHGHLIMPLYDETADLWRGEEEMGQYFPLMIMVQLFMTAILAYIFTRHYEDKGIGEGVRFGVMIGLFVAIGWFGMIAYMPIPITLAGAWFAASFVQMLGLGVIFSLIYKN